MKTSKYNYIHEVSSNVFMANLISGGIIKLDKEGKNAFIEKSIDVADAVSTKDLNMLREGRFIVDDEIDELTVVKARYRQKKYGRSDILKITIIPTYNCNFKCIYCYQSQLEVLGYVYSKDVIEETLLDSLESYINHASITKKKIHIEWFGGEPLLLSDIIVDFNYRIKNICEQNDAQFESSVVTNGYLLKSGLVKHSSHLSYFVINLKSDKCNKVTAFELNKAIHNEINDYESLYKYAKKMRQIFINKMGNSEFKACLTSILCSQKLFSEYSDKISKYEDVFEGDYLEATKYFIDGIVEYNDMEDGHANL
ncbi:MAG: radical SAM protein [Alkaliphilus sp.]